MSEKIYPVQRNLDNCYFRVRRNDKLVSVCFSDLTAEEKDEVMKYRSNVYLRQMCRALADALRRLDTLRSVGNKELTNEE